MRMILSTLAAAGALAALPAQAHIQTFVGTFSGGAEFPPNSSLGTGSATVIIDDHDDTMQVTFNYSGLTGNATAAHIHCCTVAAGTGTSGVATPTPTFPGMVLGNKSGSYDALFDMTLPTSFNGAFLNNQTTFKGNTALAFAALVDGIASGHAYLNIHSSFVPGGEIRAFFTLVPVPEPETYALMLAGLGVLGWAARRKQQR